MTTRLGSYGGARQPYGDFSTKVAVTYGVITFSVQESNIEHTIADSTIEYTYSISPIEFVITSSI